MEDRFQQQLKKGILELLVLGLICEKATYGYELMAQLKERSGGSFVLKEGTLYPILYRLEDDGMIGSAWSQGEGKNLPKKMYHATQAGQQELLRRLSIWFDFSGTVNSFFQGGSQHE